MEQMSAEEQHYAEASQETQRQRGWHVDRTIPLALVFMLFVQTAGALWWASNVTSRVQAAEVSLSSLAQDSNHRNEQVTRLEVLIDVTGKKLDQIDAQLDEIALYLRGKPVGKNS